MGTDNDDMQLICAYLDRQMSASQRKEFELRLQDTPALKEKLAQCIAADEAFRRSVLNDLDKPMPEHVLDMLDSTDKPISWYFRVLPLAASVAVVGLTLLLSLGHWDDNAEDKLAVALQHALDSKPSAQFIWLDEENQVAMEIKLSFRHQNGQYCREFVVDYATQALHQIACYQNEWKITTSVQGESLNMRNVYLPAGAEEDRVIEGYLDNYMASDAFDAEQEKTLIQSRWQ